MASIEGEVSRSHRLLAEAEALILRDEFHGALQILSTNETLGYFVNKRLRLRTYCLIQQGHINECVRYMTEVYTKSPNLYSIMPIMKTLEAVWDSVDAFHLSGNISLPILHDMYSRHVSSKKDYLRQYAVEDFLAFHGIQRPSQLSDDITSLEKSKMIYFLRYLCVPHIIDSSTAYASSQELEDERIAVCQMLVHLDAANKDEYQAEITAITLRQVVQRGMRHIEQTKIYVDIEGIKETASRDLREGFNRYLAFQSGGHGFEQIRAELRDALIKAIEDAGHTVVSLTLPKSLALPNDEKADILKTLIIDIRDEFVFSTEHGLNGYLSVRIRHGTFSGELRSPFEAAHLLTQRERGSSEYRPNEYWPEYLKLSPDSGATVGRRLAEFSKQFDAVVERIIKEWIQIRTTDEGIGDFDFRVFDNAALAVGAAITGQTTFEEFLDAVLDGFWQKLESNLAGVRNRLSTEAWKTIDDLLSSLQADLRTLESGEDLSQLENVIANARTEMSRTLARVIDWFKLPVKTSNEPFSMAMAVTIAIETVRRFYSHTILNPAVDVANDLEVLGALLPSIVDILVILFDNVVKHSYCVGAPVVDVVTRHETGRVRIVVENEIGKDVRNQAVDSRLQAIRQMIESGGYKRAMTGEGGTGFFKIRKILDHDFGSKATVDFGFSGQERFQVVIHIPTADPAR